MKIKFCLFFFFFLFSVICLSQEIIKITFIRIYPENSNSNFRYLELKAIVKPNSYYILQQSFDLTNWINRYKIELRSGNDGKIEYVIHENKTNKMRFFRLMEKI